MAPTALTTRVRRRAAALSGPALLVTGLVFTLSACGSDVPSGGDRSVRPAAAVSLDRVGAPLADVLTAQATAQATAARTAQAREPAREPATGPGPETAPKVCTTAPADRAACRNPGGRIDPRGGDLDGDGVFEPHEPVGPGYKDPRAYDGGRTSGETQCAWLRSQGKAC
ncbi:hypothetical protein ACF068_06250 [Streptomyces sp. NPDC016309]|uniref:hypothetical protein n=1 Tax=Streptomyces sp. NPDC016309 TaxID=3364965 RepID=UPI0037026EAA